MQQPQPLGSEFGVEPANPSDVAPRPIDAGDKAAFDRTVQISIDSKVLKAAPTGTAYRNDLAEKALAALGSSVDTKGASWQKAVVTLTEGGK